MELGLTWPLQRLLHLRVSYGEAERAFCWDAHCIMLYGRSSLLLVHCESRYTLVRFDLSPFDWTRLDALALEEISLGLLESGTDEEACRTYLDALGELKFTRTHGRREVAFLNRAWEDVLAGDLLIDRENSRQPLLNAAVNDRPCRCAGEDVICSAREHLLHCFKRRKEEGAL
ncbi:MAG: hypothetical protein IJF27_07555 [Oscillospiraceae bacterium]|nr:hypothetical protein [Oscillospiraceae bacterium]